jgi:hypothetical protein
MCFCLGINQNYTVTPKAVIPSKNLSEYDKALVQHGSITFWVTEDFEKTWLDVGEKQSCFHRFAQ